MKQQKIKPAQFVIKKFGGVRATARAIGRSPSAISMWTKSLKLGGRGGKVPAQAYGDIIKAAKKLNMRISLNQLHYGSAAKGKK